MATLEIRLFGNAAVRIDGQAPAPPLARKELWLFAYLVLRQPQETSRETLASLLWPETDEETARFYLRKALSNLRRALGPFSERLLSPTPRTLQLDLSGDEVFCDLLAFDRATTPAERAALHVGPLLQGCYDDWILPERERRAELVREAEASVARPASNLPVPLTELLGREKEQEELAYLVRRSRLTTLLGPGGSGKTRLSLAVAEAAQDAFEDGVWFVDLSSLTEGSAVDSAALKALNLTEGPGQAPRDALLEGLATKSLLLVLDNAEHVLDATTSLTLALLTRCPKLKVLATSRQALGLNGEQVYPVMPLSLPPAEALPEKDPHALLDFSALRLFVERATQASPSFRLSRSNVEPVAEVCRRLDGMPLAIEMAATRVRYQSVEEISVQLGERLDSLSARNQAVPERQRSLEAAIGWSYNLLSEEERAAFRAVSVFHGGWTGAMAESILPGSSGCLPSLVEKSLVTFHPGGDESEEPRYSMLQTLQQFAVKRAEDEGERESLQRRHLDYFRTRSEESRENLVGPKLLEELAWLERERDNIRATLRFGCESEAEAHQYSALTLAGNLWRFWYVRSYLTEATQWYDRLLCLPGCQEITGAQGLCQLGAGLFAQMRGERECALRFFETCLERQREIGNRIHQAQACICLCGLHAGWGNASLAIKYIRQALFHAHLSGNLNLSAHASINLGIEYIGSDKRKARRYLEKGLAAAREQGNLQLIGNATRALGDLLVQSGELEKACELGRESLEIWQKVGRNHGLTVSLCYMGLFLEAAGKLEEARDFHNRSLLLAQELRIQDQCTSVLQWLAALDEREGRRERATTIWGAGMTIRAQDGVFPYDNAASLARLRESLGDDAFDAAFARGTAMTLDEVIDLAVASPKNSKDSYEPVSGDMANGATIMHESLPR